MILHWLGLSKEDHVRVRAILKMMHAKNLLQRRGVGSFKWKSNVTEWNENYPLRTPEEKHLIDKNPPKSPAEENIEEESKREIKEQEERMEEPAQEEESEEKVDVTAFKVMRKHYAQMFEVVEKLNHKIGKLESKLEEESRQVKVMEIQLWNGKTHKVKNIVKPAVFEEVCDLIKCSRNVLLVGPAGCGKTHLADLIAQTFNFRFAAIGGAGLTENHLLGSGVPNLTTGEKVYQGTEFQSFYEEGPGKGNKYSGSLFLFDEYDAADANVLLSLNTALANNYCILPNRIKKPRAEKHDLFRCIATANTFGRGASRQYAGRNQIDEASLDRFRIGLVEMTYDPVIEAHVCPNSELRESLQTIRKKVEEAGLRRVVSSRFIQDAYIMTSKAGWTLERCVQALTSGWSDEEVNRVVDKKEMANA